MCSSDLQVLKRLDGNFQKSLFFHHRKPKRSRKSCSYYSNTCAARQLLLLGEDISLNPGPVRRDVNGQERNKPKCDSCKKNLAKNHKVVHCSVCNHIYHFRCAGLNIRAFKNPRGGWMCTKCALDTVPFPSALDIEDCDQSLASLAFLE